MTFEEKIKDIIQNYNLGNFLKAESLAKSLLTKNVKDYQLCNIYGLILLKLNKTEGAISYFQKSIHIKSDFFEAHFNLLQSFYDLKKYILLFPFCSINLPHKKWPYYNDLILLINKNNPEFELVVAPGPYEIEESKKLNARVILKDNKALTITQLAGLMDKAQFIISNDTGPAHMAAHLGAKGVTLFGYHTTPKKVSIETNKFKAIIKDNLNELSAEEVYSNISKELSLV